MLRGSTVLFILTCLSPAIAFIADKYYMTEDKSAVIKLRKMHCNLIECYIIADQNVIQHLTFNNSVPVKIISNDRFLQVRSECMLIQEKVIPKVIIENREELLAKVEDLKNVTLPEMRSVEDNRGISRELAVLKGIYPGTLWCGRGNLSHLVRTSDGLGERKELDACCKEHHGCVETIAASSDQFGLQNESVFTYSHCSCDEKFKQCLHRVSTKHADNVGKIYFDFLSLYCFKKEYRYSCVWCYMFFCPEELKHRFKPATPYEETTEA